MSLFRPETSSANFYKATENSNSDSTKNHHSDHLLPGRFTLDEQNNKRPEPCKGHIYFSLTAIGVHSKSEKIRSVGNPETRIFGPGNRLSQDGSNFTNRKNKKFNSEMQKFDGKSQTNIVGNYKLDRFTLLNNTSCDASIFTNNLKANSFESKFNSGTSMVSKQPRNKSILSPINKTIIQTCFLEGLGAYCQKMSIGGHGLFKSYGYTSVC